ncbi:hypothetical protein [Croceitalea sp. P059]|uniref:hypothetical protein n=1 Tax=Croceitalea sp. P059 TaxID=3075601 RepID=UPI002886B1EB|nr:hypothetical protein [Croceitalea sp. P059]MDT0541097.1 hypothetical protein [Croceitalea sp. P059]
MRPRSLRLFKKKKGIHLNPDQWVGIFLTAGVFFMAYLEQSHGIDLNGWVTNIAIIWVIYVIGLMISTFFRYESEFGEYAGKLTFWDDRIQIDEESYNLSEIKKLDFIQAFDIRGKFVNSMLEFTPHLSNGLDNIFAIRLKNGLDLKCNFQQTETDRIKHFKEMLVHYHKNGILGWLQLLDLLEITEYDKIQEFKKEIK